MMTFLPYASFRRSAAVLDDPRLGRQQVEAWQALQTLLGRATGFDGDPVVKMWRGYERSLAEYGIIMATEWQRRNDAGVKIIRLFMSAYDKMGAYSSADPPWLGDERLHSSHRAALLAKDPAHYGALGWAEEPCAEYWWPTKEKI